MLTKAQAISESAFHENHETGGKIFRWRRNGATKTWKTRPDEFRVPVKYGLYRYGYIDQFDARNYHAESECQG